MSSSRIILIFLGFIFVIILILTSNQISAGLRSRFGSFVPGLKPSPTPTSSLSFGNTVKPFYNPTPTLSVVNSNLSSTPAGETPATGPENTVLVILGGFFVGGFALNKLSSLPRNN